MIFAGFAIAAAGKMCESPWYCVVELRIWNNDLNRPNFTLSISILDLASLPRASSRRDGGREEEALRDHQSHFKNTNPFKFLEALVLPAKHLFTVCCLLSPFLLFEASGSDAKWKIENGE